MDGGSGSSLGVISQKCEEMKPRRLQLFPSFWSSREDDAKAKDNICGEAAWGGEEATLSERQRRSRQVGRSWKLLSMGGINSMQGENGPVLILHSSLLKLKPTMCVSVCPASLQLFH